MIVLIRKPPGEGRFPRDTWCVTSIKAEASSGGYCIDEDMPRRKRRLFVTQSGHGIEAAGPQGGDVTCGTGDEGERGGGQRQG